MDPHNFSIYACGACGIVMVCGAIWLLKTGVIKLSAAVKGGSLTVELADKVRISTTYPALGPFVIGLAFVALAIWASRTPPPLNLVGKIWIDKPSQVTVSVQYADTFTPDSDGQVDKQLRVDNQRFTVVVNAAGYEPQTVVKTLKIEDARQQRLALPDDLKFSKANSGPITVAAPPVPGHIEPVPAGVNLEPVQKQPQQKP